MKKYNFFLCGLLAISLMTSFSSAVSAESKPLTKEVTVKSASSEYVGDDFEKNIIEDGKEYELTETTTTIVDKQDIKSTKTTEKTVDLGFSWDKDKVKPGDTVKTPDGAEVAAVRIESEPYTVTNRAAEAYAATDYGYAVSEPMPDAKKTVEYYDDVTKKSVQANVDLKDLKLIKPYEWLNDFSTTLTVKTVGALYYLVGDEKVKLGENKPELEKYSDVVYKLLKLPPESYKFDSYDWQGDTYEKDGEKCRDILVKGQRYAGQYQAVYSGSVKLPDAQGYTLKAVYNESAESVTGAEYLLKVTAKYAEVPDAAPTALYITVGIALLIILTVAVIYVISRRRKKQKV